MPRLFVALELPPEIRALLARLRARLRGARWTREEQLHLTLRFLGDVPEPEVQPLAEALRALRIAPFDTALAGVGRFPPGRAPRVLWAGLAPTPALTALSDAVERTARALQFPPAEHPFVPHLTLARLSAAVEAEVQGFLEAHATLSSPRFGVAELVLFESALSPAGARYTARARVPLDAPASA